MYTIIESTHQATMLNRLNDLAEDFEIVSTNFSVGTVRKYDSIGEYQETLYSVLVGYQHRSPYSRSPGTVGFG